MGVGRLNIGLKLDSTCTVCVAIDKSLIIHCVHVCSPYSTIHVSFHCLIASNKGIASVHAARGASTPHAFTTHGPGTGRRSHTVSHVVV